MVSIVSALLVALSLFVVMIPQPTRAQDDQRLVFGNQLDGSALLLDSFPTSEETTLAAPDRALGRARGGRAMMTCALTHQGGLDDCRLVPGTETPTGFGFGTAVIRKASDYRFRSVGPMPKGRIALTELWTMLGNGPPAANPAEDAFLLAALQDNLDPARGLPLATPIFQETDEAAVSSYGLIGHYFPKKAAEAGVAGIAVVECKVVLNRRLEPCLGLGDAPLMYGFMGSAIRMAHAGYMRAPANLPVGTSARFVVRFPKPK